jgi:hypothetical protein
MTKVDVGSWPLGKAMRGLRQEETIWLFRLDL